MAGFAPAPVYQVRCFKHHGVGETSVGALPRRGVGGVVDGSKQVKS